MSAAQFSETLKTKIFDNFRKISRSDRQKYLDSLDTNKLRKAFEAGSAGASSVFTNTGLGHLKASLIGGLEKSAYQQTAEKIISSLDYENFAKYVSAHFSSKTGTLNMGEDSLRLSKVPQNTLSNLFLDYVGTVIELSHLNHGPQIYQYIVENIQSGHLAGVFSLKLKKVLNIEIDSIGESYRDFSINSNTDSDIETRNTLEIILKALLDADFVTSNLVEKETIFAKATKSVLGNNPHLEIELQFKKDNKEAGDLLQSAGKYLNNLLNSLTGASLGQVGQSSDSAGASKALTDLIKSLRPLATMVIKRAAELNSIKGESQLYNDIISNARNLSNIADSLIRTKGSPSLDESVGLNIFGILSTGKPYTQIKTVTKTRASIKNPDVSTANINARIKKVITTIKQVKATIVKKPNIKLVSPKIIKKDSSVSLASLQRLLDANLVHVMSAKMGSGSETKVLNYRTGRLAESAKVNRLVMDRNNTINAFYSYMRNPYGTFSQGGRQENPKSRDPKLLISSSIREIAATRVTNRMRAILV